jgi:hypothetical protein
MIIVPYTCWYRADQEEAAFFMKYVFGVYLDALIHNQLNKKEPEQTL